MIEGADLILRPGLIRWGWAIGFGAFMALCGGLGLRSGWPLAWPYLIGATALFGLSAWAMAAPRMQLRLSSTGFAYGTMRRRCFFRWADVAGFGVAEFASHRWVVFVFAPGYPGDEPVRRINQGFGRFDRFLPDTYGLRAVALAELLEDWRLRHTRRAETDPLANGGGMQSFREM